MIWNAKNGRVRLDDTEMSYVSFGEGERAFILLPGLSDGLLTVRGKALMLARPFRKFFGQFTVYMFSRKDEMPEGYSIRDMASDQARALEALGIREADVMGVSQGGMVAQYLAIDHPEVVRKLVLAVTAPGANDMIRKGVTNWMGFARKGDHKSLMIDTAEKGYSEAYLKKYRKIYPVIGAIGKPKNYDRFMINAEAILGFDARADLDKITCPTLIIGGEEDRTVGIEGSYELKEGIPGSELFVYPGLGHAAYEEAADFNDRVYEFLCR